MAEKPAPFIPAAPEETGLPPAFWRVFGTSSFFRLWIAQVVSSLGDWIGLIAILAIAARVSNNSGAAVSLVMVARVVPGFFLATVGGVIIDRFDRRKVMVACDIGRAGLLALLPFVDSLVGLVIVSFLLEILTLLWGPAKDASVPNLVDTKQLASANSLSLVAAFGTFPIASLVFSLLACAAVWLGGFSAFASLKVDQEFLALWVDGADVPRVGGDRLPPADPAHDAPGGRARRLDRDHPRHQGGHWLHPSRPPRPRRDHRPRRRDHRRWRDDPARARLRRSGAGRRERRVRCADDRARLRRGDRRRLVARRATTVAARDGVPVRGHGDRRRPHRDGGDIEHCVRRAADGASSARAPGPRTSPGFTVLQENVTDELRGRTFATLYTVIRLCLLISLTISPLWADFWDAVSSALFTDQAIEIGGATYALPGVRFALWGGGLIAFVAGFVSWRAVQRTRKRERQRVASGAAPEPGS